MRRSQPHLERTVPLLFALVAALCRPCCGQPASAARSGAGTWQKPGGKRSADTVNVLVLTPYKKRSLRPYGLKVMAGLCLALSEAPDGADTDSQPKPAEQFILHAGATNKPEPVNPEALWPLLVKFSKGQHPFQVTVGWPHSESKPPAIRFCFEDEKEFHPPPIGPTSRLPYQIVFGPVTSDVADQILTAMEAFATVPIVTASATETALTDHPGKSGVFYRFICPDQVLVRRLAVELVHHVRARRIAVLYEDSGYGQGLLRDFRQALADEGYADARRMPAFMYPSGLFSPGPDSPPDREERLQQMGDFLVQLRLLGVDAVGIFGSLQDKKGILNERSKLEVPGHPSARLVFTTDADLGWEGFRCDGTILIGSLLDPHDPETAELATHAFALLAGAPVSGVQPDVYMLQARRVVRFLIKVARQMRQRDSAEQQVQPWELSAAAVFNKHRGHREPRADRRADPEVWFGQNGDLKGNLADPQLLILKDGELAAIDSRPVHLNTDIPRLVSDLKRHPLGLYLAAYLAALLAVVAGRIARVWDEDRVEEQPRPPFSGDIERQERLAHAAGAGSLQPRSIIDTGEKARRRASLSPPGESPPVPEQGPQVPNVAQDGFPPLIYERGWLRRRKGWPDWLAYHLTAGTIFLLYVLIVTLERQEEVSFFPNEFSVMPTVCIQCHLAAVCLWYVAHMRAETWRLWKLLPTAGLCPLRQPLEEAAKALFPARCRRELRELWRQFRRPAGDPQEQERKKAAQQILAAVCRRYVIPVVPAVIVVYWDVHSGIPLSPGSWARGLYILLSFLTSYVFMFTLWFVWEAHSLAQQLAAAYPLGDNLWHTYYSFRMLVAPFVELAFLTALVFAGVVISRSRFFDHWEWSFLHYQFFTVIAGLLLYLTYDDHRQWHLRMCAARQRILNNQSPTDPPNEEQRRALDLVQAVPTWPWNPMQSLRIIAILIAPLVVALLQNNRWALELWRSAGQLLGSK